MTLCSPKIVYPVRNSLELIYILNQFISDHVLTHTVSFQIKFNIIFPSNIIFKARPSPQIYQLIY
jgi:hypothetical protein